MPTHSVYPWLVLLLSARSDAYLVIRTHIQLGGRNSRLPDREGVALEDVLIYKRVRGKVIYIYRQVLFLNFRENSSKVSTLYTIS